MEKDNQEPTIEQRIEKAKAKLAFLKSTNIQHLTITYIEDASGLHIHFHILDGPLGGETLTTQYLKHKN